MHSCIVSISTEHFMQDLSNESLSSVRERGCEKGRCGILATPKEVEKGAIVQLGEGGKLQVKCRLGCVATILISPRSERRTVAVSSASSTADALDAFSRESNGGSVLKEVQYIFLDLFKLSLMVERAKVNAKGVGAMMVVQLCGILWIELVDQVVTGG